MLQKIIREQYFKFDRENNEDPKIGSQFIYERFDNLFMIVEDKIENYDWNRNHEEEYCEDLRLKHMGKTKGLDIPFAD